MIDEALVEALVAEQFPAWAHLTVRAVLPGGHDNRTFRLGDELVVRLPSAERYVAAVAKEQTWLPGLAAALPLPVPAPVAAGVPSGTFPWPWSVNRWLPGETLTWDRVADPGAFATDLADVLLALHRIGTAGAPPAGAHNFHRGGDLAVYDAEARTMIADLDPDDVAWATGLWERARSSRWLRDPVWVHGDVSPGNLLVQHGRLSALIDFGGCGVGDPAADLTGAWAFFDAAAARVFADRLALDRDTWDRAAGWALWKSLRDLGGEHDAAHRATLVRLREGVPAER